MNVLQPQKQCQGTRGSVFKRIDERNMAVYTGVGEGETMSALRIVDADGHIREEVGEIQEYWDPPFAAESFSFRCGRVTADSGVHGFIRLLRSYAGAFGRRRDREGCALSNPRSIPWIDSRSGLGLAGVTQYDRTALILGNAGGEPVPKNAGIIDAPDEEH